MFDCDNCPKSFTGRKAFAAHCKANCGRNYHTHRDYAQQAFHLSHLIRTPYPDKNASIMFECNNCVKSFTSSQALVAHWKANCGSTTCDLCDRPYNNEQALVEHLKAFHPYCFLCQMPFVSSQAFEQHYRNSAAHADTYCHMCDLFFEDESTKQQHMRDVSHKIVCAICNKNFKEPKALQKHLSTKHKAKITCFVCPSKFREPSSVALHLESGCKQLPLTRHHITAAVNSLNIAPRISLRHSVEGSSLTTPRPLITYQASESSFNGSAYECPICSKTFRALYSLETHLNSPAHDEDEFKCPKCDTHFKLVSGLVQHLESGCCGLSNLKDVKRRFADMQAQLSRSLEL